MISLDHLYEIIHPLNEILKSAYFKLFNLSLQPKQLLSQLVFFEGILDLVFVILS